MVFILQYLHTHYSCNSYIYRGSQLLVCIRQSHFANMSTFQRQTPTSCYSIYSHFLFISLFALSITQCKSQVIFASAGNKSYDNGSTFQNSITQTESQLIFASAGNKSYDNGSTFQKNLITVLGELVQNTPMTGLNVSSHGDSPNRVYGLLQCRGDASSEECYNCCQNVTAFVTTSVAYTSCYKKTECWMWLDVCSLHYRNYSTSISNAPTDLIGSGPTLDGTGYKASFQKLLYNLSVEASASSKKFANGSSVDSSGQKIYALVQCFADISGSNCSDCLSKAIGNENGHLSGSNIINSEVHLESCFYLLSNQSASFSQSNISSYSKQLPINLGVRGGVLVLISLHLLLL